MSEIKKIPYCEETEKSILACCFIDGADMLNMCIARGITAESFYLIKNRVIFDRLMGMLAENKPIEIGVLSSEMRTAKTLDEIGGYGYLTEIMATTPTTAQAAYFVQKLEMLSTLREIIRHSTALADTCYQFDGESVADEIAGPLNRLLSAASGSSRAADRKWKQVISEATARAQATISNLPESKEGRIPWPWALATKAFQAFRRKELVIIAARPSVGKSSMLRAIVLACAKSRQTVLFESIEVPPDDIADQSAASISGVSATLLGSSPRQEQQDFLDALAVLDVPNLHVFDSDRTLAAIVARAKAIHAKTPLHVLAVDYLGLIADCEGSRHETKAAAIGKVTKALKRLAGELDCVLLLLCQLNRLSVQDSNREPRLTDLRDSGDIEQDADRVIFLHRPDEDPLTGTNQAKNEDAEDRPQDFVNVIQGKGRNVGQGQIVSFYFKRSTATFIPATR